MLRSCLMYFTDSETDSSLADSRHASDDDSEMNCPLATLQTEPPPVATASGSKHSLLSLLGSNQALTVPGPEVSTDISSLLSELLCQGLDSEARKTVIAVYPLVGNCKALRPPILNAEISSCLDQATLRHDTFLSKLQLQLAVGLSALAVPLDKQFILAAADPTESNKLHLEKLGDPLKLFADIFHALSRHRRHLIIPFLDKDLKPVLEKCPLDDFLFGNTLADSLKSSTDVRRVGASIKKKARFLSPSSSPRVLPPKRPQQTRVRSSGSGASLNYRRYQQTSRLKQQKEGGRQNRHR